MNDPVFVVLAGLILAVAAGCLLWPMRRSAAVPDRRAHDLAVYRDQLAEIDRDHARGLIAEDQAEAARVEIRRRIVRAASGRHELPASGEVPAGRRHGTALAILAVGLPLVAGAAYVSLGRPDLPSLPYAGRPAPQQANLDELRTVAASLDEALTKNPADIEGWVRLGRARAALGEMDRAVQAVREAQKQAPDDPRIAVELGDLLTTAAGGMVTPEARALFEASVAAWGSEDQADPRAPYFLGVAQAQAGDAAGAIDRWRRLLARAPAAAPWRQQLIQSIQVAATQAGVDPALPPADTTGPSPADMEAMAALPPQERADRIRGMVDGLDARLKDHPDDADGWLRLARARLVLGQRPAAASAFERAASLRPRDPEILLAWGEALIGSVHEPTGLPLVVEPARQVFARMDEVAPDDPRPAWFLGLAAAQAGDRAGAVAQWQRMLARLPADNPDRKAVEELVEQLGG